MPSDVVCILLTMRHLPEIAWAMPVRYWDGVRESETAGDNLQLIRISKRPIHADKKYKRALRRLMAAESIGSNWYAWQDSNLRPVAPEATALSI